jgi:predicted alpha/beta hydrolase family esterase
MERNRSEKVIYINLPGIGNSGPNHWQSWWEKEDRSFRRFAPASWEMPELDEWIDALNRSVKDSPTPPILVAHSLACLLVAHWALRSQASIAGAFLVAVPDPMGSNFPPEAASFGDVPGEPFRFPALVVASRNDPYGRFEYAQLRALQWHAGLVDIGERGHIGGESGLGDWRSGRQLLSAFEAGLRR